MFRPSKILVKENIIRLSVPIIISNHNNKYVSKIYNNLICSDMYLTTMKE